MRRIAVLDAPSNLGLRPPTPTSVPGCAKAPGALRDHGLLRRLDARDAGCLTPPRYDPGDWRPGDGVSHASEISTYSRKLADRIGAILDQGEFPVILGGDCSIVLGSALAMHRLGEAVGGRIGLVFVDGHSDFRHPGNASYVGAAAGEDLALVTGRGQHDLAAMEGRRPYYRDIDVVVMGIRAQDEYRLDLQAAGIVTRPVPTLRAEGAARSAQWARDQLVDCAGYWVHVDVDVLDPAVMPAVDAPEPGGIAFPELELLLSGLVESPHCLGVEITVFDPDYDPDGAYAEEITSTIVAGLKAAHTVDARPDLVAARRDLAGPGRLGPGRLSTPPAAAVEERRAAAARDDVRLAAAGMSSGPGEVALPAATLQAVENAPFPAAEFFPGATASDPADSEPVAGVSDRADSEPAAGVSDPADSEPVAGVSDRADSEPESESEHAAADLDPQAADTPEPLADSDHPALEDPDAALAVPDAALTVPDAALTVPDPALTALDADLDDPDATVDDLEEADEQAKALAAGAGPIDPEPVDFHEQPSNELAEHDAADHEPPGAEPVGHQPADAGPDDHDLTGQTADDHELPDQVLVALDRLAHQHPVHPSVVGQYPVHPSPADHDHSGPADHYYDHVHPGWADQDAVHSGLADQDPDHPGPADQVLGGGELVNHGLEDHGSVVHAPADDEPANSESADDELLDHTSVDHETDGAERADVESADHEQADTDLGHPVEADHDPAGHQPASHEFEDHEFEGHGSADHATVAIEPADPQPADIEPTDIEPADQTPADLTPTDQGRADQERADQEPVGQEPADGTPTDQERADQESAGQEPVDQEPVDQEPADQEAVGRSERDRWSERNLVTADHAEHDSYDPEQDDSVVRTAPRPLGSAPLLDSKPLPATMPGMLRPRAVEEFSLPAQRPAFEIGPEQPADLG